MNSARDLRILLAAAALVLAFALCDMWMPRTASAFPFGGQITIIAPCYNDAIYALLSGPRGGAYIWTPSTKTYEFGAPSHAGQWLLGLAGAPYYCIVNPDPLIIYAGTYITMMGSSK